MHDQLLYHLHEWMIVHYTISMEKKVLIIAWFEHWVKGHRSQFGLITVWEKILENGRVKQHLQYCGNYFFSDAEILKQVD